MKCRISRLAAVAGFVVVAMGASGQFLTGASAHEVTITKFGENSGKVRVVSTPAGIDCPGACSAEFPDGTPVTLTAELGAKTHFEGFWFHETYVGPNGNPMQGSCRGAGNEGDQCYLPGTDDAMIDLQHYLLPEPGIAGISINDGDVFTNDPKVELTVRWQFGSAFMTFSNDGGFGKSKTFDLKFKVPWTLQSSGPERLPKTVYAIFNGGGNRYADDIILDETAPVIGSVAEVGGSASSLFSRSVVPFARGKRVTLRVRASDRTSGVSKMQVGSRPSGKLKKIRFRSRVSVVAPRGRAWVRVFDRAGNASRWKSVNFK